MIDENRQDNCRNEQELHTESIVVVVIGGLEAHVDQVQRCVGGSKENHLREESPVFSCVCESSKVMKRYKKYIEDIKDTKSTMITEGKKVAETDNPNPREQKRKGKIIL